MRYILLSAIALLCNVYLAHANRDSIGVKNVEGKLFILHKVSSGEGLYAVARRYNVDVTKISAANPGTESGLLLGQVIMVPYGSSTFMPSTGPSGTPTTTTQRATVISQPPSPKSNSPLYHTVASGETLYRIATNNKLSVQQLKDLNNLTDNTIEIGQKLIIGYKEGVAPQKTTETVVASTSKETPLPVKQTAVEEVAANTPETVVLPPRGNEHIDPKYQQQYDSYQQILNEKKKLGRITVKEVSEGIAASWIDDGTIVSRKSLALHRTAPPGTIIQVTNPMNGKVVYVKVIANLPKNVTEENVDIKITKTAADQLGVLDKFFRVETHYSMEVIK